MKVINNQITEQIRTITKFTERIKEKNASMNE